MRNGDPSGDCRRRFGEVSGDDYGFSGILDRNGGCRIRISSVPTSLSPSPSSAVSSSVSDGCIEHLVSKLDTLAGIAIKYGVEVSDIKKMNGLVTDLQMFALRSIKIPLPGRHPPSHCESNGSPGQTTPGTSSSRHMQCDLLDSFQSLRLKSSHPKVSPAMSTLQGYYGLKPKDGKESLKGFEMSSVYRKGNSSYFTPSPASNPPFSHHRKSRSLVNTLLNGNSDLLGDPGDTEPGEGNNKKFMRRRQKSETFLDGNSSGGSGGFSATPGNGLTLRSKAASRTNLIADSETFVGFSPVPADRTDSSSPMADGSNGVCKTSSASTLQEQDCSNYSFFRWPTTCKWTDLQSFSAAAAIARPIFDGLPNPLSGRKNKDALD